MKFWVSSSFSDNLFNSKYNQFLTSNLNKLSEKLEETQNFI